MIIITGQGFLGTLLAWELLARGYNANGAEDFVIVDKPQVAGDQNGGPNKGPMGAWQVAAGILNSIPGQSMNPSERMGEYYTEALDFYAGISVRLGKQQGQKQGKHQSKQIYTDCGLVRCLTTTAQKERWQNRQSNYPERYQQWLNGESELQLDHKLADIQTYFKEPLLGIISCKGGWVDMVALVEQSRAYFKSLGCYQELEVTDDMIQAWGRGESVAAGGNIKPSKVFLTQGLDGLQSKISPFGKHRSALGEILTLNIKNIDCTTVLNWGSWLLPVDTAKGVYRFGATYDWDWREKLVIKDMTNPLPSIHPSQQGRDELETKLQDQTLFDYEVLDHHIGVRPIVRRSQPVIKHINDRVIAINGLGSKGSLYAPKLAQQLVSHVLDGSPLDKWYELK